MCFRSKLLSLAGSCAIAAILAVTSFADVIHLKDGGIIKGRIASFSGGKFIVEIGKGARSRQMTFTAAEIESIIFETVSEPSEKTANLPSAYTPSQTKPSTPPRVVVTDSTTAAAPIRNQQPQTRPQTSSQPAPSVADTKTPPIQWNTKVLADNTSNGWTNSGWVLKKGQRVRVTGDGSISLGNGQTATPSGIAELEDTQKLLKSVPTGALIAVIGDDNNDFIYIGAEREFTAARDGALFLGINEGNLNDNSGAFNVKIEIITN